MMEDDGILGSLVCVSLLCCMATYVLMVSVLVCMLA